MFSRMVSQRNSVKSQSASHVGQVVSNSDPSNLSVNKYSQSEVYESVMSVY